MLNIDMDRPAVQPFTDPWYKIAGYTGYVRGLKETIGRTPVMSQGITLHPSHGDFLHTRTFAEPKATPQRDPCNFSESYKPSTEAVNLWPCQQETGDLTFKI